MLFWASQANSSTMNWIGRSSMGAWEIPFLTCWMAWRQKVSFWSGPHIELNPILPRE